MRMRTILFGGQASRLRSPGIMPGADGTIERDARSERARRPPSGKLTSLLALLLASCTAMPSESSAPSLALGASYTIGESVAEAERFPNQLARALKIAPPQIIAKTGWTTDELNAAIDAANPHGPYRFVTLL